MSIRLDKLVAQKFELSRRSAQEAVRNGKVDLNGLRCDEPGLLVDEGAELSLNLHRPKVRRIASARVEVLFEDDHVLIVNKPPGILTLPTANHESGTLSERVEQYLRLRHGPRLQVGIIHRLDKETSGAIVFAKHAKALGEFQELFRVHNIERQYLAVVEGVPLLEAATVERPLVIGGDNQRHRVARPGENGVSAVTHFRVIERFGRVASLLACWLETGRTHQIRLHLADMGLPVVGDSRYRPPSMPLGKARFKRQALHAQTLGFTQPITGQVVRVEAPLPPDLASFVDDLRTRYGIRGAGG
jgi:23S rRNA pseudouridine1911/1915/1917 synthase